MRLLRFVAILALLNVAALSCLSAHAQSHGTLIFEDTFLGTSLNTTIWNPFITDNSAKGWPWINLSGQPFPSSATGRSSGYYLDYDLASYASTGAGLNFTATKGS